MSIFFFRSLSRSITSLAFLLLVGALVGCGAKANDGGGPAATSAGPTLRLVQSEQQAALEIWADDVSGFYALDMELRFDPAKLQVVDADPAADGVQIQPGQVPTPDFVVTNAVDNQNGVLHYVVTQLAPREGFSGSGLVATITCQGDLAAEGAVSFGPVTLVDQDGQAIEITVKRDGSASLWEM